VCITCVATITKVTTTLQKSISFEKMVDDINDELYIHFITFFDSLKLLNFLLPLKESANTLQLMNITQCIF